jgi:hypothetical protein
MFEENASGQRNLEHYKSEDILNADETRILFDLIPQTLLLEENHAIVGTRAKKGSQLYCGTA